MTETRRRFLARLGWAAAGAATVGVLRPLPPARAGSERFPTASSFDGRVATAWFDLVCRLIRLTPGYSPPVASRAFGYVGVTLYEALVPGMPEHRGLAGRLSALSPTPGATDPAHHWPAVANAALASVVRNLFPTAPADGLAAIDSLEARFGARFRRELAPGILRRSVARGRTVANHIFGWSRHDGGDEGYLRNFPAYTPPVGPGLWVPTPPAFLPALQPYWGSNRPFMPASGSAEDPGPPPPYSESPSSAFYAEARECYEATVSLTPEQEAVALFWSDDPAITFTPPGHSVSILTQVIADRRSPLDVAAEAYARVGIAVADAFIACWRIKYRYNLLRPVTYIRQTIDPTWTPLLVTPPFPEYTSGHSVQSAATAEVLTDLFGTVAFVDHTHADRGLPPRSFGSFFDAAEEAAISRLYGGIHFRAGIERGFEQGRRIGSGVNELALRRTS